MSDRIQKLKNESRRLPKNPMQGAGVGGARRVSHGIIGVRKVRRTSAKSNTSNGSRNNNPFSDLVPHQSRSSVSARGDRRANSPQPERRARRSKTGLEQSTTEPTSTLSRSQSQSINQLLTASIANHTLSNKYNTIESPRLPDLDTFESPNDHSQRQQQAVAPSLERDIPIRFDQRHVEESHIRPSITALEDGFVQQDDEQAMENMAMDKIDRFLESLGSEGGNGGGKPPILPPIIPTNESDNPSLTAALKKTIKTTAISPELRQLVSGTPVKSQPQPAEQLPKSPEADKKSIHSWATTTAEDEELKAPSVASTPSIRPLSIVKSPTNNGFGRPQGPVADPDETFRGVKVAWLIEMYHDYMAEKSKRPGNLTEEEQSSAEIEKVSPSSSKGLRPLLLPGVVATEDNSSTRNVEGTSPKRPTMARGLTFGAPRTPTQASLKGSGTPSSGSRSKSPPTLQRSMTGLPPLNDPKPSPPPFKRTVTGLTQQDAVEVARTKMNAAMKMQSDHFIDQVIEATALLSPTRSTFTGLETDERAIAKQHVSPVRDTFSSPKLNSPPFKSSPPQKSSSPPMSLILPPLAHEYKPVEQKVGGPEASKREHQKRPANLSLAKSDDRKCIVTNNVAFFDPFGTATPRPASPVSPTLSEANLRMNRQFLEGINNIDTGLASSMGSRVAAKLSPPLIHGESGLKNMQLKEAESTKTSVSEEAAAAKDVRSPTIEAEVPLMLHEDSTSEDDELLPKMRPRFEGLGVSSKAQKLLGMSEAKKSVKSRAAKTDFPMSRSDNADIAKLQSRSTPVADVTKVRPVSRADVNPNRTLKTHEKQASGGKLLVEPFDEAKFTSQLTKTLADQKPQPEAARVKSKPAHKVAQSTASSRAANADFDVPAATTTVDPRESGSTGLISIKFGDAVSSVVASQPSPTRPALLKQGSSVYPEAREDIVSPTRAAFVPVLEKAPVTKKQSPPISQQKAPSPVAKDEVRAYGPFANYRINQESSSNRLANGHTSMSPNSNTQAISPNAEQARNRETGFRVSPTSRSPSSPEETKATGYVAYKKPSVYYDSPEQERKVSRGKHGRLSIIEHGPIDISASKAAASVHGLGLGMSPTAPAPSHVFEQILHSEKSSSKTRPVASRSSTLDRINKSATPTMSKSGSSADGRSERSIEYSGHTRAPSDHNVKTAVPISYYQPRTNKESLDPFRNLDMKTVAAPRKTSHEQKQRPVSYGFFANTATTTTAASASSKKHQSHMMSSKSDTSDTSATDMDRNYTTRVSDFAPDAILSPRTQAPRLMANGQSTRKNPTAASTRPATMMAAREVHEKFDIRRALARSDDGEEEDDEYDSPPANTYDAPEEVFGAFANTATQAFSKWFG